MSLEVNHPSLYSGRIEKINLPEKHFFRVPESSIGIILRPDRYKNYENMPYIDLQDSENQEPYQKKGSFKSAEEYFRR